MSKRVPVMLLIVLFGVLPALADQSAHVVVSPDTLKWAEPPILPGAKLAVVQGDPSKEGPFVYRLKMPAGYKVPPHFHRAAENVTVLTGVFTSGSARSSIRAPGRSSPSAASSRCRRSIRTMPGRVRRRP